MKCIPSYSRFLFWLCVWTALQAGQLWGQYGGGSGTAEEPYQIRTAEQLNEIGLHSEDRDKHFQLTADVDMSAYTYTTALIAPDTDPSYWFQGTPFTGVFDGAGHRILNLTISNSGDPNDSFGRLGLFGQIAAGGEVRNLGLENVSISGDNFLGGLCGSNGGTITNCYVTGSITGGDSSRALGGLCGSNQSGTITNCRATGSVTGGDDSYALGGLCGWNDGTITNCYATGSVTGDDRVGGLCGVNYDGTISLCYATGSVTGDDRVGGLCGVNYDGTISLCYATGSVRGGQGVGGLCGLNFAGTISHCYAIGPVGGGEDSEFIGGLCGANEGGTIINCLWDVKTSGRTWSAGGMGLSTEDMQKIIAVTDAVWDSLGETGNGVEDIRFISQ